MENVKNRNISMKNYFYFVLNFILISNTSDGEIMKFELSKRYYDRTDYFLKANRSFQKELDLLLEEFEQNLFFDKRRNRTVSVEEAHKTLENNYFEFNRDSNWEVRCYYDCYDCYCKIIFYFYGETCTLYLTENEALDFLEKDIFDDFVVPVEVYLDFNNLSSSSFIMEYEIQSDYIKIANEKPGYRKNIMNIFCFMKGLFIISMNKYKNAFCSDGFLACPTGGSPETHSFFKKSSLGFELEINSDEFKNYVIRASQEISGELYFHYFHKFVKNEKIKLSQGLKKIFDIFDNSDEQIISQIIYSGFLFVDIPEDLYEKNLKELEEIEICLSHMINIVQKELIIGNNELIKVHLEKLKEKIDAKALSPVIIQRALGYYNIEDYFQQNIHNRHFLEEFFREMNKNAKDLQKFLNNFLKEKARYSAMKAGDIKKSPISKKLLGNLYKSELNTQEYEICCGKSNLDKLVVSRVYNDLEEIYNFIRENLDDVSKLKEFNDAIKDARNILDFISNNELFNEIRDKNGGYFFDILTQCKSIQCFLVDKNTIKHDKASSCSPDIFLKNSKQILFYSVADRNYFFILDVHIKNITPGINCEDIFKIKEDFRLNIETFKSSNLSQDGYIREKYKSQPGSKN